LGSSKQKQHTTAEEDVPELEEVMMVEVKWMQPYLAYMLNKTLPEDVVEVRQIVRWSKGFVVYRESYTRKAYPKFCKGVSPLRKDSLYYKTSMREFVVIMPAAEP
jgi:hypothetical protein